MRDYPGLELTLVPAGCGYHQPQQFLPSPVRLDNPAIFAMTDFKLVPPAVIDPEADIDTCNRVMMTLGGAPSPRDRRGASRPRHRDRADILGEKPMRLVQDRSARHADILVRDVMTPREGTEALPLENVLVKVGHIAATLRAVGCQHATVPERSAGAPPMLRGVFSASQIARPLGLRIEPTEVAHGFARIQALIAG